MSCQYNPRKGEGVELISDITFANLQLDVARLFNIKLDKRGWLRDAVCGTISNPAFQPDPRTRHLSSYIHGNGVRTGRNLSFTDVGSPWRRGAMSRPDAAGVLGAQLH